MNKFGQSAQESSIRKHARKNYQENDYKEAVKSFSTALQIDADDQEARLGLAESYLKLGESKKAHSHFAILERIPEFEAVALQGIGMAELLGGNIEGAAEPLQTALSLDPALWRAWNSLARIHDLQRQWPEAEEAYKKALENTDYPEVVFNNMGVSYMAQEEFSKAAEAFKTALDYQPGLEVADTNYRLALAMSDRYDEATLARNNAEEAKALNNTGYAAMRQGKYNQAEKLFVQSLETSPSFYKPAYDNLQVLYHIKNKT